MVEGPVEQSKNCRNLPLLLPLRHTTKSCCKNGGGHATLVQFVCLFLAVVLKLFIYPSLEHSESFGTRWAVPHFCYGGTLNHFNTILCSN